MFFFINSTGFYYGRKISIMDDVISVCHISEQLGRAMRPMQPEWLQTVMRLGIIYERVLNWSRIFGPVLKYPNPLTLLTQTLTPNP